MHESWKIPVKSKSGLTDPNELAKRLQVLVGQSFPLGATRTNGTNLRKLIATTLLQHGLPAPSIHYKILPTKKKGVPRMLREWVVTSMVSGTICNFQIWNPGEVDIPIIELESGDALTAQDVRYIMVRINPTTQTIESIIILTPQYVIEQFGKMGKLTIKHQLLIPAKKRVEIVGKNPPVLFRADTAKVAALTSQGLIVPQRSFNDVPSPGQIVPLTAINQHVLPNLIGKVIPAASTKIRGQALEGMILQSLGYSFTSGQLLEGGYPDIRNQLLEVKIQDTQTVDLGMYTPQIETIIDKNLNLTTHDVRYLIALTDAKSGKVEGVVLSPGANLGDELKYVDGVSGKSQRSIPMSFFDKFKGQSVFNPPLD